MKTVAERMGRSETKKEKGGRQVIKGGISVNRSETQNSVVGRDGLDLSGIRSETIQGVSKERSMKSWSRQKSVYIKQYDQRETIEKDVRQQLTLKAEEGNENEKNEATSKNNQSIKEKRKEENQHPRGALGRYQSL